MIETNTLSRSELRRLRSLLEQDWPGIDRALYELEKELKNDGVKDANKMVSKAVCRGLHGYRDCIYLVNVLGKISDPVRLATFVSHLLDELITLLPTDQRKSYSVRAPAETQAENLRSRKNLYELFIEGPIRETLRDNGYEQQILVGSSDRFLCSDAGNSDLYSRWMGD